jgi:uncharacterized protein (TIGR04255 family)
VLQGTDGGSQFVALASNSREQLMPDSLPDYERPPVRRVVLGIAFQQLSTLRSAHLGLFWSEAGLASAYPVAEEFDHAETVLERLDDSVATEYEFDVDLVERPPVSRTVFSSVDLESQIAVQDDLLQVSWVGRTADSEYPRYSYVSEKFREILSHWTKFLSDHDLGVMKPLQAQVTYVNYFSTEDLGEDPTALGRLVKFVPLLPSGPQMEDFHLGQRYALRDGDSLWGRLYMSLQAGHMAAEEEFAELAITVRAPATDDAAVWTVLDRGHGTIVRSFDDVSTSEAHKLWGRL